MADVVTVYVPLLTKLEEGSLMSSAPEIELTPRQREVLLDIFARHADKIATVGVYGSRVQGRSRPGSDVDLVVYGKLAPGDLSNIGADLEESDLSIFADVIGYDSIGHAPLKRQIDSWMVPLFSRRDLMNATIAHAA